ncbi:hypothetical protein TIFTF001_004878 [Ficus carica]|uniref:Uncharacterized protein n=1 Tax=Ficus carica TaxID=3494 RepID=A0AA88CXW4_FICCA|nr:hypothetical protein TIFTF001_004878 [Ficus carica]
MIVTVSVTTKTKGRLDPGSLPVGVVIYDSRGECKTDRHG